MWLPELEAGAQLEPRLTGNPHAVLGLRTNGSKATNEEIIAEYRSTGSVWQAAKRLGMGGQSVHERLVALGYPLATRAWSSAEVAELRLLVGQCTIGEIARRLGRPYAGVALKISQLGLAGTGRGRIRPIPRGAGYDKATLRQHMKLLGRYGGQAHSILSSAWPRRRTVRAGRAKGGRCLVARIRRDALRAAGEAVPLLRAPVHSNEWKTAVLLKGLCKRCSPRSLVFRR